MVRVFPHFFRAFTPETPEEVVDQDRVYFRFRFAGLTSGPPPPLDLLHDEFDSVDGATSDLNLELTSVGEKFIRFQSF